jgi:vacuolar-type H+-ATPase subunit F/Vma7
MAAIKFLNMGEAMQKMSRILDSIKKAQKTAAIQMGQICKQTMQAQVPPHIVTSHWQKSIRYWIEPVSDLKIILTVGSTGAERYYYIQESINHPIEIGLHQAKNDMTDAYQRVITQGLLGRAITQNVSSSNIDEFAMMAGF